MAATLVAAQATTVESTTALNQAPTDDSYLPAEPTIKYDDKADEEHNKKYIKDCFCVGQEKSKVDDQIIIQGPHVIVGPCSTKPGAAKPCQCKPTAEKPCPKDPAPDACSGSNPPKTCEKCTTCPTKPPGPTPPGPTPPTPDKCTLDVNKRTKECICKKTQTHEICKKGPIPEVCSKPENKDIKDCIECGKPENKNNVNCNPDPNNYCSTEERKQAKACTDPKFCTIAENKDHERCRPARPTADWCKRTENKDAEKCKSPKDTEFCKKTENKEHQMCYDIDNKKDCAKEENKTKEECKKTDCTTEANKFKTECKDETCAKEENKTKEECSPVKDCKKIANINVKGCKEVFCKIAANREAEPCKVAPEITTPTPPKPPVDPDTQSPITIFIHTKPTTKPDGGNNGGLNNDSDKGNRKDNSSTTSMSTSTTTEDEDGKKIKNESSTQNDVTPHHTSSNLERVDGKIVMNTWLSSHAQTGEQVIKTIFPKNGDTDATTITTRTEGTSGSDAVAAGLAAQTTKATDANGKTTTITSVAGHGTAKERAQIVQVLPKGASSPTQIINRSSESKNTHSLKVVTDSNAQHKAKLENDGTLEGTHWGDNNKFWQFTTLDPTGNLIATTVKFLHDHKTRVEINIKEKTLTSFKLFENNQKKKEDQITKKLIETGEKRTQYVFSETASTSNLKCTVDFQFDEQNKQNIYRVSCKPSTADKYPVTTDQLTIKDKEYTLLVQGEEDDTKSEITVTRTLNTEGQTKTVSGEASASDTKDSNKQIAKSTLNIGGQQTCDVTLVNGTKISATQNKNGTKSTTHVHPNGATSKAEFDPSNPNKHGQSSVQHTNTQKNSTQIMTHVSEKDMLEKAVESKVCRHTKTITTHNGGSKAVSKTDCKKNHKVQATATGETYTKVAANVITGDGEDTIKGPDNLKVGDENVDPLDANEITIEELKKQIKETKDAINDKKKENQDKTKECNDLKTKLEALQEELEKLRKLLEKPLEVCGDLDKKVENKFRELVTAFQKHHNGATTEATCKVDFCANVTDKTKQITCWTNTQMLLQGVFTQVTRQNYYSRQSAQLKCDTTGKGQSACNELATSLTVAKADKNGNLQPLCEKTWSKAETQKACCQTLGDNAAKFAQWWN